MAISVALKLKLNGTDIPGESTIHKMGGVDRSKTIECVYFESSIITPRDPTSGASSVGQRQHQPILFRKRLDKTSPLLAQALCRNEVVDAEFLFFQPNPVTGAEEHFFTIKISQGRITSLKLWLPNTLEQANSHEPALEEVQTTFNNIMWENITGKTSAEDSWSARA